MPLAKHARRVEPAPARSFLFGATLALTLSGCAAGVAPRSADLALPLMFEDSTLGGQAETLDHWGRSITIRS